jgi:hypothetical protein
VSQALLERYGSLTRLIRQAGSRADLVRRLQEFKGVGPTTTRIFLRDLRRGDGSSAAGAPAGARVISRATDRSRRPA